MKGTLSIGLVLFGFAVNVHAGAFVVSGSEVIGDLDWKSEGEYSGNGGSMSAPTGCQLKMTHPETVTSSETATVALSTHRGEMASITFSHNDKVIVQTGATRTELTKSYQIDPSNKLVITYVGGLGGEVQVSINPDIRGNSYSCGFSIFNHR